MKKIFLMCLILFVTSTFAQNTDVIVKKNIFDPKRGVAEQVEDQKNVKVEKKDLPKDLPWLDGIITIGKYKKIVLRYRDEKTRQLVSGVFKEGDIIGGTKIKKINTKDVLVALEGVDYLLNIESKYNMPNYHKSHHKRASRKTVVNSKSSKTKATVKGRSVQPIKPKKTSHTRSVNTRMTGKGVSTPFGTARQSNSSNTKRKNHPF